MLTNQQNHILDFLHLVFTFKCFLILFRSSLIPSVYLKLSQMAENVSLPSDNDWLASTESEDFEEEEGIPKLPYKKTQNKHSPHRNRPRHRNQGVTRALPTVNLQNVGTISDLSAALNILQSYGFTVQSSTSPGSTPLPSHANKPTKVLSLFSDDYDSHSEDDDPPEEETTREKAARIRGASRARIKRAKSLAEKRRKVGLKPYVLKIDAYCKHKGLYAGLWTTMIRAHGKRLDCNIDNLRGHPPGVVDSIFETLHHSSNSRGFFSMHERCLRSIRPNI